MMFSRRLLVCLTFLVPIQLGAGQLARAQALSDRPAVGESASLVTRDGVQLKITYFPAAVRKGSPQAKQVTPVVLLPDYKGSRAVFAQLAQKLLSAGETEREKVSFAAVTVDLRGHGDSLKQSLANGTQVDLDPSKLNKDDLNAMATEDLDTVRSFLVDKNDAGELNLNKLCLVGSGMGASVAANWAQTDWQYPPLAVGKQGQDVKAIVLISPRWTYNGLTMQGPMQFQALKKNVAWMLISGDKDPKVQTDIGRIKKQLERFHPAPAGKKPVHPSGFKVVGLQTKLQGDSLITQNGASTEKDIVQFLTDNVAKTDTPWIPRRNRLP
jgi:pimeloyl-ACP methyl ester carboxylesterase